jgi:hypothetical protein
MTALPKHQLTPTKEEDANMANTVPYGSQHNCARREMAMSSLAECLLIGFLPLA